MDTIIFDLKHKDKAMGEVNSNFYNGPASRTRLRKLGSFYATMTQPWFSFIEDIVSLKIGTHISDETYEYHDLVNCPSSEHSAQLAA